MAPPKRQQRTQALDNLGDMTVAVGAQYVPVAQLISEDVTPASVPELPSAKVFNFTISRDANHADDTYASPIAVVAFAAEFVS